VSQAASYLAKILYRGMAGQYPIHAVKEWAGHRDISTAEQYYLQATEDQYTKAAAISFWNDKNVAEKETENEKEHEKDGGQENENFYKPNNHQCL